MQIGSETVLVVDDEEMILDVGKAMLSRLGYTVMTAQGGQAGVEVYSEHRETIAAVILDMVMPGTSGESTFQQLKAIDPNVVVLLSSGYSLNDQASRIIEKGCEGFIQKPFSINELSRKLRDILDHSQNKAPRANA